MSSFEDALWRHLADQRAADRIAIPLETPRRPRLLVGAFSTLVVAAVLAALLLVLGVTAGSQPAYALTRNADGSITVSLSDIATGIPALNAKFAALGIRETVIPVQAACTDSSSGPLSSGVTSMTQTVTVSNQWIPAGEVGFLAAKQLSDGQILLASGTAAPPAPKCFREVGAMGSAP